MALQTTQTISRDTTGGGLTPTFSAVSASDTFNPGNTLIIYVKNGGGSTSNVAIQIPTGKDPIPNMPFPGSRSFAVPAGGDRLFGPWPSSYFADPTTGLVTVTYSFITSVTAAYFAVSLP